MRSMRRLYAQLAAVTLLLVVVSAVCFRWAYFGQQELPGLRLSRRVGRPLTRRLVLVLVDSVSFELAFEQRKLPRIAKLRSRGRWGLLRDEDPTMTGQMVYTLATGARPYLYGVVRNWRQNRMGHETFLDVLGEAGLRVEFYGDVPWSQMFGDRFYHFYTIPEEGRRPDGRPYHWLHALNELDHHVIAHLDAALARPRFDALVWHIHGTDLVMHKFLRDSRLTALKLRWADLVVSEVVRELDDGQTTFLILSDHGCAANGRHGYEDPEARRAFYLLFGPHVRRGGRLDLHQVDIAPTVAALVGRTPPAPSAGRPAVEALDLTAMERARLLVAAAHQRQVYLQARGRVYSPAVLGPQAPLQRAETSLAAGRAAEASRAATAFLREAWSLDLASRRERSWIVPAISWLLLLGGIILLGLWLGRSARPGDSRPSGILIASVGLGLALLWAVALAAVLFAGRAFNDHIDLWRPWQQLALWAGVAAALGGGLWALRRRFRAAWRRRPVLSLWTGAVGLAVLPGYFQGIYVPALLLGLLGWIAWKRALPGRRWWGFWALATAILGVSLVWAYSWRPHLYFVRGLVRGPVGAELAAVALALAAWVLLRVGRRQDEAPPGRRILLAAGLLVVVVLLRHLLLPLPSILRFPTVGDQVLASLGLRLLFAGVTALLWALAWRLGLRGPRGAALGALATLAAWGSAFEALAFSLLAVGLAPLGQARWLDGEGAWPREPAAKSSPTRASGSGSGSGLLAGASWRPVLLGAVLLVTGRVLLQQPLEYYFNFTAVHDLFRFAPDMDGEVTALAVPVLLRYALPALVLVPLLLGRLSTPQRLASLTIALVFAGARCLHLMITTRLTIDQLYANWRGVGELIITAAWAVSLVLAVGLWELGRWLTGRWLARSHDAKWLARSHDA